MTVNIIGRNVETSEKKERPPLGHAKLSASTEPQGNADEEGGFSWPAGTQWRRDSLGCVTDQDICLLISKRLAVCYSWEGAQTLTGPMG